MQETIVDSAWTGVSVSCLDASKAYFLPQHISFTEAFWVIQQNTWVSYGGDW